MAEFLAAFVSHLADLLALIGFFRTAPTRRLRLSLSKDVTHSLRVRKHPNGFDFVEKRTKKRRFDLS